MQDSTSHQVLAKQHFSVPPFNLRHADVALRTAPGDLIPGFWVEPNSLAAGARLPVLLEGATNQVLQLCAVRRAGQLDSAHDDFRESDSQDWCASAIVQ